MASSPDGDGPGPSPGSDAQPTSPTASDAARSFATAKVGGVSLKLTGSPKSATSRRGWSLGEIAGKNADLRSELMALDRNGDGQIDLDELTAAVEELSSRRSTIRSLKLVIGFMALVTVLIVGATFGLSFATASLSQKVKTGNGNALVDSSSGATLRTASGQVPAAYALLDAIKDSNNVTTVRYTVPRSVAKAGCQLYGEGHFSIPASLIGPRNVYGGSVRPRSYTIIEAFGCSVDGSLPDNSGLEATLKADMFDSIYVFFSCPPNRPDANCTAAQFFTAEGTSLSSYSGIDRRKLFSPTSDLITHMSTTSRRAVLLAAVPHSGGSPARGHEPTSTIALTPAVVVLRDDPASDSFDTDPSSAAATRSLLLNGAGGKEAAAAGVGGETQPETRLRYFALEGLQHEMAGTGLQPAPVPAESGLLGARRALQDTCKPCPSGCDNTFIGYTFSQTTGATPVCIPCSVAQVNYGSWVCGNNAAYGYLMLANDDRYNPTYMPAYNYPPNSPHVWYYDPYNPAWGRKLEEEEEEEGNETEEGRELLAQERDDAMNDAAARQDAAPLAELEEQQGAQAVIRADSAALLPEGAGPKRRLLTGCLNCGSDMPNCDPGSFAVMAFSYTQPGHGWVCKQCEYGFWCPGGIFMFTCPGVNYNTWKFRGDPSKWGCASQSCCPPAGSSWNSRRLGEGVDVAPEVTPAIVDVYRRHVYASPDNNLDLRTLSYYDCVICTYLWRQGLLPDTIYAGDAEFAAALKKYAPIVHAGYLTYARKVVSLLSRLDARYTTKVVAPLGVRWAELMSVVMGRPSGSFNAEGALVFSAATPGTVLLGLTQALLPAIVADLMSWVMVAWIMGVTCAHYAAAAVGLGWVGLLAPQVAVLAGMSALVSRLTRPRHSTSSKHSKSD